MFTKNIKDSFTANLLSAVSGVLGEAKKCKDCGCAKCECDDAEDAEETKEGYMPTNDMPSAKDRATAGKLGALLKRERSTKEKKETNGVKTEETEVEEGYDSAAQRKAVWANRADDGKGHPDKKKMKKEEADMPFEKPYKKVGERKDEYGNKVKNVAKHLAKKAMKANEEVEEIEEKRGLWDNIHAKRKRIKAGSGEKMRKPGSEGAPSAADLKASQTEEMSIDDSFEQIDEISAKTAVSAYAKRNAKAFNDGQYDDESEKDYNKLDKQGDRIQKKFGNKIVQKAQKAASKEIFGEEVEELDEISKGTMGRYINKAKDSIDTASYRQGHKEAHGSSSRPLEKKLSKRHKGIETAVKKLTKEESEQIDELSKATMGSYIKKASGAEQPKNVMSPKNVPLTKIAAYQGDSETGHFGKRFNQATYDKAERLRKNRETGIKTAVSKLTKEEQDFIDSLNADTLDEARGRPRKAGARDFTIHPKTKEKLMHDNPEHMKRIEALQKTGMLQKPKTEAGQHIMNQLRKAKTSMLGGSTVNFTHGDSKHVSGTHAAKLLDRYAGMKPDEKEAFQKKIGHSHAKLKSEL